MTYKTKWRLNLSDDVPMANLLLALNQENLMIKFIDNSFTITQRDEDINLSHIYSDIYEDEL